MRRGKSYYKKGEIWLYSRVSPGKGYYIASFPGGNLARGKGYCNVSAGHPSLEALTALDVA